MPLMRHAFAALLILSALAARGDAPGVYAITGGTVHTAAGADIANGVVIVRDGLIEAVGAGLAIPADAATIDAAGMHVYPGLIDAQTSLGFTSAKPAQRRRGGGARSAAQEGPAVPETSPSFLAINNVKLSDDDLDAARSAGITTILTVPTTGIFNGQSVILNLGSGSAESRVVKQPATMQVSFNTRSTWVYPDSLMGVMAYIRQTLLDAQQYAAARAVYDRSPAGNKRPEENLSSQALGPVLLRELPVVFVANDELMMRRALAIAKEMNLRLILAGARQAYKMPDELKQLGVPLLVSVNWPKPPADKDDREEQPLRVIRDRQLAPTTPAALVKSGAAFALVSGGAKSADFAGGIRKAMDNGLTADDALRATTIWPARILGVDRQLGSLERGKIANVVVTDKPIFAKERQVKRLLIDGREVRVTPAAEKKKAGAASAIDGTWSLSVRSAQGDVAITATLHGENGTVTGTYSGDRGSGEIRNGSLDGTTIEFTITATGSNQSEAGDWVFHGTVSGTSMTGTVSTNLGSFQFTGSKAK
ncbi:MAG TPA: amidohydrolase family protein [Thermoanaerobaculia bacterium]|nr:amidohydrolase family protein [Thermoanaerobaculia bacterium]